jgi:hypothetical protein
MTGGNPNQSHPLLEEVLPLRASLQVKHTSTRGECAD